MQDGHNDHGPGDASKIQYSYFPQRICILVRNVANFVLKRPFSSYKEPYDFLHSPITE